ncbi:hypothetical protein SKAU_G00206450 [Synaphobranchus kaupii]|uniref:S-arrestin n=1 Tax=Synaphobranchus kaupii TaxID=118154 RepID=A0A9Q1IYB9_SYNKA|nr:hypothetical protein SKAU_G00206450 [Synaphobranchus kaupii]
MAPRQIVFKKLSRDPVSGGVHGEAGTLWINIDFVDPVDGVVLVDPTQLKDKKAYVALSCTFRTRTGAPTPKCRESLLHKLGHNAYPFFFELPDNLPCSVGLQPAQSDVGKLCAVEFEVKAFSAKSQDEKPRKRSTVKMMIRKVQHAPERSGPAPSLQTTYDFAMSDKPLLLEASLEKQTYYHGEKINVHLNITNNSNRTVKSITILVEQMGNVVLYCHESYVEQVAMEQFSDTVDSGGSLDKVYTILPTLANNRQKKGIALDGRLKYEDTNLASSSIVKEGVLKEVLGILVSYRLVVKLKSSGLIPCSEVRAELPFQLMHPKPDAEW